MFPSHQQLSVHGDRDARLVIGSAATSRSSTRQLLFRFSALTYNAHRIHYDHHWVRREGHPDLVVHGPLQALMMGELHRRAGDGLVGRTFEYRLVAPWWVRRPSACSPPRTAWQPAPRSGTPAAW